MRRHPFLFGLALAAVALFALAPYQALAKDNPASKPAQAEEVRTPLDAPLAIDSGKVRGLAVGPHADVHLYRGIPFAAPPVGEGRWRPPQPPESWEGVRDCFEFGHAAPQKPSPMLGAFPGMSLDAETNEDCLYLNVWAPAKQSDEPLPVMVWIHGGGYVIGAGSQRLYDLEDLARRGVVAVAINYRLGPLGFLAHPELSKESEQGVSGNYGLLDQIAALRWVQRNIKAFGGDPNRVTIFGESAGGGSVFSLLVSPLAKGLFQRAIAESGPTLNFAHLQKPHYGFPTAEEAGQEFAAKCGAPEGPGQLSALRAMSPDDLLEATPGMEDQREFNIRGSLLRLAPVVDGYVIPDDPMTILAEGKQNDVPLIVGANRDEGTMFTMLAKMPPSIDALHEGFEANFGGLATQFSELYPVAVRSDMRRALGDLLGDFVFVGPARYVARNMATVSSPAYLYHFAHPPAGPTGRMLGAHHAAEVAYVLDNLELVSGVSATDQHLRDALVDYWIAFAATGDPNGQGRPAWPAYTAASDQCLVVGDTIEVETNLRKAKLDVIDQFMDQWRRETGVSAK